MQLIEGNIFYSIVIRQCATLVNMEVKGRKAEKQICGESGITFAPASAPTPAPVLMLMLMLKCFTALARLLMLMVMVMVRMKTIVCSKDDFQLLCALRMIFNWIYSSCAPIWSLQCSCLPCVFSFRFLQICLFWSESQPRFSAHVQRCSCPAQSWSSFPPEFACFDLKRSWKVNIVAPVDRVPGPVYYRRLPGLLSSPTSFEFWSEAGMESKLELILKSGFKSHIVVVESYWT